MNTSLTNREGKLLVDYEHGRVLRADDFVTCTERVLHSHPFIFHVNVTGLDEVYFAGPDAQRAARGRAAGEPTRFHDALEYAVVTCVGDIVTLQKVEEA